MSGLGVPDEWLHSVPEGFRAEQVIIMQGDLSCGRLRRSPQPSPGREHDEASFPGKEVALEPLSFIWKDEEAKGVGLGTSFLAQGDE